MRGIDMRLLMLGLLLSAGCFLTGCEQPKAGTPAARNTDDDAAPVDGAAATSDATKPAETVVADATGAAKSEPAPETESAQPTGEPILLGTAELTAGIPGEGPLKVEEIDAWLADPKNHEILNVKLPLGLDAGESAIKGLDKNPLTRAKIELGRQLYFDGRLSLDTKVSCAHCHHPDEGFGRHTQFGIGIEEQQGGRNSPISYNRILSDAQFWDGRAASLEEQAKGPIQNPIEMGHTHEACEKCLTGIVGYEKQFAKVFPGEGLNIDTVAKAIASFERALVTSPSPYDYNEVLRKFADYDPDDLKEEDPELFAQYEKAVADVEAHPMSESAKRGRDIFFGAKGNCTACHVGPNLSDEQYHNIGVGMDAEKPDLGRYEISKNEKDKGAFKTPTIRNVALSAPYMHDGSQKTLAEVVEWYDKGGHPNPHLSEKIKKLNLTAEEKADLVAFMEACTGDFPKVEVARLPE